MGNRVKYQYLKDYKYYTTLELSKELGVSRSTVKYWAHHGLEPIDREQRQWKFNGKDVKVYLKKKNKFFFKVNTIKNKDSSLPGRLRRDKILF